MQLAKLQRVQSGHVCHQWLAGAALGMLPILQRYAAPVSGPKPAASPAFSASTSAILASTNTTAGLLAT